MHPPTLLMIDNDPAQLDSLKGLLNQTELQANFLLVEEQALVMNKKQQWDIVILESQLLGTDGKYVIRQLKQQNPSTKIIIYTAHSQLETLQYLINQGIFAYVEKAEGIDVLLSNVSSALLHHHLEQKSVAIEATLQQRTEEILQLNQTLEQEIVRRKETELELQKLASAVEQTADAVVITDTQGFIQFVNPAFEKITGYTETEALGQSPNLVKSGHHDPLFYEQLWRTILSGNAFRTTFQNRKKNGQLFYVDQTITPVKDNTGTMTHFVSLWKDITVQKQAEQQLQDSYQTIQKQQAQIHAELEQAKVAQHALLPTQPPRIPNAQMACRYVPMEKIGGDVYDILQLDETRFGIMVADVTGHGIPAALLSFMVWGAFKNSVSPAYSPEQVLNRVNGLLKGNFPFGRFTTMFYGVYDTQDNMLTYANAGHVPPLVVRWPSKKTFTLRGNGSLLGFPEGTAHYQVHRFQLLPQDKVLFYTDGIIEVSSTEEKLLGLHGLERWMAQAAHAPIQEFLEKIYAKGQQYSENGTFEDDVALIGLELFPKEE